MLKAWRTVSSHPDLLQFRLVMVGDGSQYDLVKQGIAAMGQEARVELRSGLPRSELKELYRRALFSVHLASHEPFGLAPLESIWEGTPVLAVCEGGVRDTVIPRETGFCLESADPSALGREIVTLAARRPELERFGKKAASFVRARFSFSETVEALAAELVLVHRDLSVTGKRPRGWNLQ